MPGLGESYAHLTGGQSIYFYEEGRGEPFLYSHASLGSADSARGMFEQLRDRFHCISLDRAGYRRSQALDRFTTVEEQVEAIAVVHRACTAEPAWVFGHSGGGNWALAYAVAYPDRVRGLALMEPALHPAFPAGSRPPGVAAMIETVGPLFRAGCFDEAVAAFLGALRPELSPEALDEQVAAIMASDGRAGWESLAAEMPSIVSWCPTPAEWARLTQPALVIEGELSWPWIRQMAAKIVELLPHGELATLEGLDHGAPFSAPNVVAQTIVAFIDRVVD